MTILVNKLLVCCLHYLNSPLIAHNKQDQNQTSKNDVKNPQNVVPIYLTRTRKFIHIQSIQGCTAYSKSTFLNGNII